MKYYEDIEKSRRKTPKPPKRKKGGKEPPYKSQMIILLNCYCNKLDYVPKKNVTDYAKKCLGFKGTLSTRNAIDGLIKKGFLIESADRVCKINDKKFITIAKEMSKHKLFDEFEKTVYSKNHIEILFKKYNLDISKEEKEYYKLILKNSPSAYFLFIGGHILDYEKKMPHISKKGLQSLNMDFNTFSKIFVGNNLLGINFPKGTIKRKDLFAIFTFCEVIDELKWG